jgi:hypothetical protein
MTLDSNLGIWGNKNCVQCGACCYDYYACTDSLLCKHQEIKNKKSYCLTHEDPNRADTCKKWFCGQLNNSPYKEDFQTRLIEVATNILKTNPPKSSTH